MDHLETHTENPDDSSPDAPPPPEVSFSSSELLQGHREILIRHGEDTYRLRLTRNGKLILHK
jgi:hemin uptake protein HemP